MFVYDAQVRRAFFHRIVFYQQILWLKSEIRYFVK